MQNWTQHRETIERLLGAFDRRWKRVRVRTGLAGTALVAVLALCAAAVLDYAVALSHGQRILVTLAAYAAVLGHALVTWFLPWLLPVRASRLAWMLERLDPSFNERLISSVEFSGATDRERRSLSRELIEEVLSGTELDLARLRPEEALPLTVRPFVLPGLALLVFVAALLLPGVPLRSLVKRVVLPSAADASVGAFALEWVEPTADRFAEGDAVRFVVMSSSAGVREVELQLDGARTRRLVMRPEGVSGRFVVETEPLYGSFVCRAVAGRVASAQRELTMLRRPAARAVRLRYDFPAYTGLASVEVERASRDIRALRGTSVLLHLDPTKPIRDLWVTYGDARHGGVVSQVSTGGLCRVTVDRSGPLELHFADHDALGPSEPVRFRVEAVEDAPPVVTFIEPAADMPCEPAGTVAFTWEARDNFGIAALALEADVNGRSRAALDLATDARAWSLPLEAWGLAAGDTVRVRLTARDGAGQSGAPAVRTLSIVGNPDLVRYQAFRAGAQAVAERLAAAADDFAAMQRARTAVRDAQVYRTASALEDLAHNQLALHEYGIALGATLGEAARAAETLATHAFFDKAATWSLLLGDFVRHQRVQAIARLPEDPVAQAPWDRGLEVLDLSRGLATGLVAKADQHAAALGARLAVQVARFSAVTPGETAAETTRRMARLVTPHLRDGEREAWLRLRLTPLERPIETALPRGWNLRIAPGATSLPTTTSGLVTRVVARVGYDGRGGLEGAGGGAFAAGWQAWLWVPAPMEVALHLRAADVGRVRVDDEWPLRLDERPERRDATQRLRLERGFVELEAFAATDRADGALDLQWEPAAGPRAPLPAERVFSDLGQGGPAMLQQAQRALKRMEREAADTRRLDALAAAMRAALQAPGTRLADVAREAEWYERPAAWRALEEAARSLVEDAAAEADSARRLEGEAAAAALRAGAVGKDVARVAATVPAVTALAEARRTEAVSAAVTKRVATARRQAREAAIALRETGTADAVGVALRGTEDAARSLQSAAGLARAMEGEAARDAARAAEQFDAAARETAAAVADVWKGDTAAAQARLRAADSRADAGVEHLARAAVAAAAETARTLAGMDHARPGVLERVEPVVERVESLEAAIGAADASREALAQDAWAAVEQVRDLREDLLRDAGRDLLGRAPDARNAADALVMAAAAQSTKAALAAVQRAITAPASVGGEAAQAAGLRAAAREGVEAVRALESTAAQYDALWAGRLAASEAEAWRAEARRAAEAVLPPGSLAALDRARELGEAGRLAAWAADELRRDDALRPERSDRLVRALELAADRMARAEPAFEGASRSDALAGPLQAARAEAQRLERALDDWMAARVEPLAAGVVSAMRDAAEASRQLGASLLPQVALLRARADADADVAALERELEPALRAAQEREGAAIVAARDRAAAAEAREQMRQGQPRAAEATLAAARTDPVPRDLPAVPGLGDRTKALDGTLRALRAAGEAARKAETEARHDAGRVDDPDLRERLTRAADDMEAGRTAAAAHKVREAVGGEAPLAKSFEQAHAQGEAARAAVDAFAARTPSPAPPWDDTRDPLDVALERAAALRQALDTLPAEAGAPAAATALTSATSALERPQDWSPVTKAWEDASRAAQQAVAAAGPVEATRADVRTAARQGWDALSALPTPSDAAARDRLEGLRDSYAQAAPDALPRILREAEKQVPLESREAMQTAARRADEAARMASEWERLSATARWAAEEAATRAEALAAAAQAAGVSQAPALAAQAALAAELYRAGRVEEGEAALASAQDTLREAAREEARDAGQALQIHPSALWTAIDEAHVEALPTALSAENLAAVTDRAALFFSWMSTPIHHAREHADVGRLDAAAVEAARSPLGETASDALDAASGARAAAAREAGQRAADPARSAEHRQAWGEVATRIREGRLDDAAQRAARLPDAEEAVGRIDEAKATLQAAREALDVAHREALVANPHQRAAESLAARLAERAARDATPALASAASPTLSVPPTETGAWLARAAADTARFDAALRTTQDAAQELMAGSDVAEPVRAALLPLATPGRPASVPALEEAAVAASSPPSIREPAREALAGHAAAREAVERLRDTARQAADDAERRSANRAQAADALEISRAALSAGQPRTAAAQAQRAAAAGDPAQADPLQAAVREAAREVEQAARRLEALQDLVGHAAQEETGGDMAAAMRAARDAAAQGDLAGAAERLAAAGPALEQVRLGLEDAARQVEAADAAAGMVARLAEQAAGTDRSGARAAHAVAQQADVANKALEAGRADEAAQALAQAAEAEYARHAAGGDERAAAASLAADAAEHLAVAVREEARAAGPAGEGAGRGAAEAARASAAAQEAMQAGDALARAGEAAGLQAAREAAKERASVSSRMEAAQWDRATIAREVEFATRAEQAHRNEARAAAMQREHLRRATQAVEQGQRARALEHLSRAAGSSSPAPQGAEQDLSPDQSAAAGQAAVQIQAELQKGRLDAAQARAAELARSLPTPAGWMETPASGAPGQPGQPAMAGQPGQPGEPGQAGQAGQPGQQGQSGQPAMAGQPGAPAQPGAPDAQAAAASLRTAQAAMAGAQGGAAKSMQALGQVAAQAASQQLAQAARASALDGVLRLGLAGTTPSTGLSGGGSPGGRAHADAQADGPGIRGEVWGDAWTGPDGHLKRGDAQEQDARYSAYFQRAMQAYMQRVTTERARLAGSRGASESAGGAR